MFCWTLKVTGCKKAQLLTLQEIVDKVIAIIPTEPKMSKKEVLNTWFQTFSRTT